MNNKKIYNSPVVGLVAYPVSCVLWAGSTQPEPSAPDRKGSGIIYRLIDFVH